MTCRIGFLYKVKYDDTTVCRFPRGGFNDSHYVPVIRNSFVLIITKTKTEIILLYQNTILTWSRALGTKHFNKFFEDC